MTSQNEYEFVNLTSLRLRDNKCKSYGKTLMKGFVFFKNLKKLLQLYAGHSNFRTINL